jgi:hypothetical protein
VEDPTAALIEIEDLRRRLDGRRLPGAEIPVERYESALADHALLAPADVEHAHPLWLVVLALRGMGITVDELCDLAAQRPQDTLLFGNCALEQYRPLPVGHGFRITATVGPVTRKESRSGGALDFITVDVDVHDLEASDDGSVGHVTEGFVIKRGT